MGIRFAAAQSAGIEELVDEHGVTPTFELTPAQRRAIYQELHKEEQACAQPVCCTCGGRRTADNRASRSTRACSRQQSGNQTI